VESDEFDRNVRWERREVGNCRTQKSFNLARHRELTRKEALI
jgi:hypothetical protein